jgi:uncharacterized protein YlzI (FlbEa/FlbD family)
MTIEITPNERTVLIEGMKFLTRDTVNTVIAHSKAGNREMVELLKERLAELHRLENKIQDAL